MTEQKVDFTFEFHTQVEHLGDAQKEELRLEAERRLIDLAAGHSDLIGASLALRQLAHDRTPHAYEARVTGFVRPNNLAAVEKAGTAKAAIKGALDELERQVREKRERLRDRSR
ncbi:MAG: HPF/RaiA family ribosome-associated protein [Anaerolineae bacterium]|jgi:ribosome-associated translation inhibitor RaiA